MDFLTDWITEWLKGLLIDGIMGNLSGLFDNVNNQVGEIATQVGTSPTAWNAGVFSLIRQLSETVDLPIAGMVLTFVMCYELIQMIVDRNNLHDIDTWMFFKWVFKTFVAVMILSNTFNIAMAVFDVAQSVVNSAGGLISGSTAVTSGMMDTLEAELTEMDLGPLLGLFLQSFMFCRVVLPCHFSSSFVSHFIIPLLTFKLVRFLGGTSKSLINLAQNLDCYEYYPDIHDEDDLGRFYIEEMCTMEVPEHLQNYIDYEAYGRDMSLDDNGQFVDGGYIVENGDSFIEYYNGRDDLPEEHRIFAYPEPEKSIRDTLKQYQQMIDDASLPVKDRPTPIHEER